MMAVEAAGSLSALLDDAIARHAAAGHVALVGEFGEITYAELGRLIAAHARAAREWGIQRGELVGIVASRSPASVALFFGLMRAGACPCFIEPRLAPETVLLRMRAVGMTRLAVDRDNEAIAAPVRAGGMDVRLLTPVEGEDLPGAELSASDLAMMQFTSGSTGLPKGVLLTHGNLLANARGVIAHTVLTPADRLLHVMPLYHTNAVNNQLVVPFIAGASVALVERFRAEEVEGQLARYRPTYMTGVPTMYSRILPHLSDPSKRASLRFLRCGSAPITVELHRQIEEAFGVPLVVSYGLSEATCTSTMNPPGARRIGTVGTVLDGQDVRLLKPGTTEEAGAGGEGEICIAGPCLMRGYVGAGAEQPIRDGWLRSGDLGRFDAEGYLAITGRIKDVIIRGGENLSPQLIEATLAQHPAIRACCVVGAPHADLGEVPIAFVTLRAGQHAAEGELKKVVGEKLSRSYIPDQIRFVDALPENSVGKVDRKALRQLV
ncbi:MAG: class I adenylate-forming enzyme family protein [Usitatibacter sp.]